jgi:tetratricopeptide (TPR) repeat protein
MRITLVSMTLAAAGALAACKSPGRVATWEQAPAAPPAGTQTATGAADVAVTEARDRWAKRDDQGELRQAIAAWERVLEKDPGNAEAMTMLARAHYFLADGFLALEDGKEEEELKTYQKGVDYGEKALVLLQPGFGEEMRNGGKFEEAIKKLEKPAMPAAYWYSVNLGRFATKQGISARLFYKDKLKATMERILELDPAYFHAAGDRYFCAFYAVLPSIAGKDLDRAQKHCDASIERAPAYLSTRVVKAQFLAKERDDEAMYRKILEEVIAAADGDDQDIAPENRAAKRHAKRMLERIADVF